MATMQSLLDLFLNIRVLDVIDVIVVAYLLYHVLVLLRRTGAFSLVKGLAVFLIAVAVTAWLPTLHYLLRAMLFPGIIALVIIFQPELRTALTRLGKAGFLGAQLSNLSSSMDSEDIQQTISEVVEAAGNFSESHIGALIVFQREVGLMDITRTGKTLAARVSAELLESIFHPKSPLHDGAVVIRGNTLVAAACVLPYTERPGLSASAGMRHRAALGVSEQTDAVCVVVSEETGAISLAIDGALSRRLDRAHLTERLMSLFAAEKSVPKFMFWKRERK